MSWKNKFPKENRYFETKNGILYCADCLEILPLIPDKSIDLILTDPPYNASNSSLSFTDKHYKTINENWDKNFNPVFYDYCVNLLKKGGQMLVFCSYHLLGNYLQKSKLKLQQILHWVKKNPVPGFTKVYAYSVEYILWWIKTGKPYTFNKKYRFSYKDVFETILNRSKFSEHPTEKPLNLITALINTHSNENEIVLDPFIGSGTIAVACEKLNRRWIGIEINLEYCEIAKKRILKETRQLKLNFSQ